MSDPRTKQEKSKFKDARQIPAPDVIPRHKNKSAKGKYNVYIKWKKPAFRSLGGWTRLGAYRTREIAEKVISDDKRKHPDYCSYKIEEA